MQRLGRTCLIAGLVLAAIDRVLGAPLGWEPVAAGSLISYMLLLSRGAVQAWLRQVRCRRDTGRCLLVAGQPDDAHWTPGLLQVRPELGYRVLGYVSVHRAQTTWASRG